MNINFAIIGFFLLTIVSCDPAVTEKKIITNQTDHDIDLIISDPSKTSLFVNDTILLNKKSVTIIMEFSRIGRISEVNGCNFYTDSIETHVIGSDSLKLILDITDQSNWTYREIDRHMSGAGKFECSLTINESHIE